MEARTHKEMGYLKFQIIRQSKRVWFVKMRGKFHSHNYLTTKCYDSHALCAILVPFFEECCFLAQRLDF